MTDYHAYYGKRTVRNDRSRNTATLHGAPWTVEENEYLHANFDPGNVVALAEYLGRTVEACRQRYYSGAGSITAQRVSSDSSKTAAKRMTDRSAWAKGFTSTEEMGY